MAVVGTAQIVIRAITTAVGKDIQRGLQGAIGQARRQGQRAGSAFGDGLASAAFLKLGALLPIIGSLLGAVAALAGGFTALGAAVAPAAGAIAALPGIVGAAVQGVVAGALAFSGLGDAIKALSAPATETARAAATNARAQEAAAERVRNAQKTVRDAQEAVIETARNGARNIARANRAVADAEERLTRIREDTAERAEDAARRVRDAAENLADAQQAAADRTEDAALRVENAERNLTDAQESARRTQEDLNRARMTATERLEDLTLALVRASLNEESAILAVADAEERLWEARLRGREPDIAQADLNYRESIATLNEVIERNEDLRTEAEAAQKAGVEGSDDVQNALERQEDAAVRVVDASRELTRAQRDQARASTQNARSLRDANEGLAEAQEAQAETTIDNARAIRDAERDVVDAQIDAAETAIDVADANADAAENLTEAQRGLALAQRDAARAGEELSTAEQKVQDAMAGLSPQAQEFARYIASLKDEFILLRNAAGELLFPRLIQAIQPLVATFLPILINRFRETGGVIGNFAIQLSNLLTSPFFTGQIDTILGNNNVSLEKWGTITVNLTGALISLMAAADPLVQRINDWAVAMSAAIAGTTDTAGEVTLLSNSLEVAGNWLFRIGELIGNTFGAIGGILEAARVPGVILFNSLDETVRKFEEWTTSTAGQSRLREFFDNIVPAVQEIGRLLVDVGAAFFRLGEAPGLTTAIESLRLELLPVLETLLTNAVGLAPQIIGLATAVARFVNALAETGIIEVFVSVMTKFIDIITAVVSNQLFQQFLGPLLAFGAALKAISLVSNFLGLSQFIGLIQKFLGFSIIQVILGGIRIALFGLIGAIGAMGAPFIIAVGAVAALGIGLITLYNRVEGFRNVVDGVVGWVKGAFVGLYNFLVGNSVIPDLINGILSWFLSLDDRGKATILGMINRIKEFFVDLARKVIESIVQMVTNVIKTWTDLKNTVLSLAAGLIAEAIQRFIGMKNAIGGFFVDIKNGAIAQWNDIKNTVGRIVNDFAGNIEGRIRGAVDTMGRVFGGIRGAFADPINFVIDRVFNGGIARAWNAVAGLVNAPRIPDIPRVAFAHGGVVPGYAPGRDTVRAMLSPGEAVLVPEAVRAIGKEKILEWNRRARRGRGGSGRRLGADGTQYFALGGLVDFVGDKAKGGLNWAKEGIADSLGAIGEAFAGAIERALAGAFDPLKRFLDTLNDSPVGTLSAAMGHTLIGKVLAFAKLKDKEFGGDLGDGRFNPGVGYGAKGRGVSANTADMVRALRDVFGPQGLKVLGTLGARPGPSDHPAGKAIDAMVYKNRELGNRIAAWVLREGHRFGLKYLIWYERWTSGKGWKPYTRYKDQPKNDTLQHRDHPHISLLDRGGWLEHGIPTLALNMTGKREAVMPQDIMRAEIRKEFEKMNVPLLNELRALRQDLSYRDAAVYLDGEKVGQFQDRRQNRQYVLGGGI